MSKVLSKPARRQFLQKSGAALGSAALWSMLSGLSVNAAMPSNTLTKSVNLLNPIDDLLDFHNLGPISPGPFAYMNNGTIGPILKSVLSANHEVCTNMSRDPKYPHPYRANELNIERERIAKFIHADPANVIYTRSTTEGMNIFAHGLTWKKGDVVLMSDQEHPGGQEPYELLKKRYGIEIEIFNTDINAKTENKIIESCGRLINKITQQGRRLRVLVVSHNIAFFPR